MNKMHIGLFGLCSLVSSYSLAGCASTSPLPDIYISQQKIVKLEDVKAPINLTSLDLLTVLLPVSAAAHSLSEDRWSIAIENNDSNSVRALSSTEFQHIIRHPKSTFPQVPMTVSAAATESKSNNSRVRQALYFGALYPGKATIFFTDKMAAQPNTTRLEISVSANKSINASDTITSSKTVIQWTEKDQNIVHSVRYGDLIEIVLPGSAADDWESNGDESGLSLKRIKSGQPGFVKLVFSALNSRSAPLTIKQKSINGKTYEFKVVIAPTPNC